MERKLGVSNKVVVELKKKLDRDCFRLNDKARSLGGTSDGIDILNFRIEKTDFSSTDDLLILAPIVGLFLDEIKKNVLKFKGEQADPKSFEEYLRLISGMLETIGLLYSESGQSDEFEVVLTDHADFSQNVEQFIALLNELFSGNSVSVTPGKAGKISLKPEKGTIQGPKTIHGMGPIDLVQKDSAANPADSISSAAANAAEIYAAITGSSFEQASEVASSLPPKAAEQQASETSSALPTEALTDEQPVVESVRPSLGSEEVMGKLLDFQKAADARKKSTQPLIPDETPAVTQPKERPITASYGTAEQLFAHVQQGASTASIDDDPTIVDGSVLVGETLVPAVERRRPSPHPKTLRPGAPNLSAPAPAQPAAPVEQPSQSTRVTLPSIPAAIRASSTPLAPATATPASAEVQPAVETAPAAQSPEPAPSAPETSALPGDVRLPSDYLTGRRPGKSEPAPASRPQAAFTAESNRAAGLPVYTPENPAPSSVVKGPFEPIPGNVPMPSDYLTGRKIAKQPEVKITVKDEPTAQISPETLKQLTDASRTESAERKTPVPEKTPAQVTGSSRKKLWAALGGLALTVLGGLGIHHFTKSKAHDTTENQPANSASASVASAKPVESAKPQETKTPPQQAEQVNYKKGMYRVNSASPEYRALIDYLLDNHLNGLEHFTRDLTGRVNVLYVENPQEAAKLKAQGKLVFSGQESPEEIKTKVFEEFIRVTQTEKIDNGWVQNDFFKKHVAANYDTFKKTGKWPAGSHDSQLYYAAITNTSQLIESPGVIGYAVNLDTKKNTALKDMKAAVPSFYHTFVEVNQEMMAGKDPANIPAYDDFNYVKEKVCYRIDQKANAMTGDYRSGLKYMHHQWCNGLPNSPYNYLNQSLQHRVPIESAAPTKPEAPANNQAAPQEPQPQQGQIHNNIINPQNSLYNYLKDGLVPRKTRGGVNQSAAPEAVQSPDTVIHKGLVKPPKAYQPKVEPSVIIDPSVYRQAEPSVIIDPAVYQEAAQASKNPVAAQEVKPAQKGLFSRMADKLKSGLGIGKNSSEQVKVAQVSQQELSNDKVTKKDIPMESWKDTLKSYFGV
jgi:hypothetical protein